MFKVTFVNWINQIYSNDKPFYYLLETLKNKTDNILYLIMIMTKKVKNPTLHLHIALILDKISCFYRSQSKAMIFFFVIFNLQLHVIKKSFFIIER